MAESHHDDTDTLRKHDSLEERGLLENHSKVADLLQNYFTSADTLQKHYSLEERGLLEDLGKVADLLLHGRGGDLQHPRGGVVALLDGGDPFDLAEVVHQERGVAPERAEVDHVAPPLQQKQLVEGLEDVDAGLMDSVNGRFRG